MIRPEQNFSWWYPWVKWLLPVLLALLASIWVGLTLTATIPTMGFLQWASVYFASLKGFPAITTLTFVMGSMASLVGIISTLLVRALLFSATENMAKENLLRARELEEINKKLNEVIAQQAESADEKIKQLNEEKLEIHQKYYLLKGSLDGPKPTNFSQKQLPHIALQSKTEQKDLDEVKEDEKNADKGTLQQSTIKVFPSRRRY